MSQLPLVDRFGRRHTYLRIAITDHCNLRCRYCMPRGRIPWVPSNELLTDDEIIYLADLFVQAGVTKIRLTGGEPTLRSNCSTLVKKLADIPGLSLIAMTSNGVSLRDMAKALRLAGLTCINISLDTLRPDRFEAITGRDRLADVLAGIEAALEAGFAHVRINAVVMRDVNDDELMDLVSLAGTRKLCVRFIEFMPWHAMPGTARTLVPYTEMKQRIERHVNLTPLQFSDPVIFGSTVGVAKEYTMAGYAGTIGFITPMTDHFCNSCNRLRLTAEGRLKSCLFCPSEVNLKNPLRRGASSDELLDLIRMTIENKSEFPSQSDRVIAATAPGMFAVGG